MSKKSISLFEALPPRGGERSDAVGPSSAPSSASAEAKNKPAQSTRKSVDLSTVTTREATPAPKLHSHAAESDERSRSNVTPSTTQSNQLKGVSVAKKEDHFYAIAFCMIAFAAITFAVGYKIGKKNGVLETAQQFQHQMADAPVAPVRSKVVTPAPSAPATPAVREPALVLPTSLQRLTKEQERSVAPPTPPKNYTLQVQTMGRNQRATIDDLVKDLRASGHEAFPNYDTGAVYVGRLESTRSQEAKRLKDSISRFNWRNRDFSSAFFIRIPSRLLEN